MVPKTCQLEDSGIGRRAEVAEPSCYSPARGASGGQKAHQELHDVSGAALLEDGNLAQEADVVAGVVLLQLLHGHRLDVPPLSPVHLRIIACILSLDVTF